MTILIEVKFHKGFSKLYEVSLENFKKATKENDKYKKKGPDGNEAYAICPLCENPVKLLGVYRKLEKQRPHARHCRKSVDGLADHNEYTYQNCPNHRERADYVKEIRPLDSMSDYNREILALAHDYFDKCIYILRKTTGLVISNALAETIALDYMSHPGYMTFDITRENVPYMMGLCMTGKTLIKRVIEKDSPLYEMLKNKKEINLLPLENKSGAETNKQLYRVESNIGYLELSFDIVNYRFVAGKTSKHREFIKLHIGIPDGEGTYETYAEKEIEVDPFFFNKLIHSKNALPPRKELADIADRILVLNE